MSNTSNFFGGGGTYAARMVAVEQQVSQFFAGEIAKEVTFPTWYTPPVTYIEKNGATLSKAAYPALWSAVSGQALTEAAYDAVVAASPISACSQYADLGGDNFRVPTVGQGGFSKAVGTNGFDIGTEDGGFGSQVEDHKHAQTFVTSTSQLGDVYLAGLRDLQAPFGFTSETEIGLEIYRGTNSIDVVPAIDTTNQLMNTSINVEHSGETAPQGVYGRVWIYTGNIVSNLPEPTPDWLAQQAVNTQAIADLNAPQSLQNMTSSRSFNTNYTNNTGRMIIAQVIVEAGSDSSRVTINAFVDGAEVFTADHDELSNALATDTATLYIPNGSVYSVYGTGSTPVRWTELR